jgi:catechol 2,3-dioxygenase-like lactoylglutathione lyase family enzyme
VPRTGRTEEVSVPGAPRFDQVNLVVEDMDASVAFYRRLGLVIPDAGPWDDDHRNAEMPGGIDFDLDHVSFARKWNRGHPGTAGRGGALFSFRVDAREDVDRIHADLTRAGYASQLEPHDAFWGSRFAIVEDPDGNAVGIMSPRDDAFRGSPPE